MTNNRLVDIILPLAISDVYTYRVVDAALMDGVPPNGYGTAALMDGVPPNGYGIME